jgi:ubiquinone/menaquinone biosynthesis C-methylase UbiE
MMNVDQIHSHQHFERWSETYDRSLLQWLLFDRIHRAVLAGIPASYQPQDILDIGCGTGRLLRKAGKRWPKAKLIGVDQAEGMVAQARQALPEGDFYVGAAEELPVSSASVDLVLSTISFHHWQDQLQGVREVRRVLGKGGLFYLADILPPRWVTTVYKHGTMIRPELLKAMFAQAGLAVISRRTLFLWSFYLAIGEKKSL